MLHIKRYLSIGFLFSLILCLHGANVHEISKLVANEKNYIKALEIAEENAEHSVNICARIQGYPSEPGKLKYFARNSKNPILITQSLRYLSFLKGQHKDYTAIADSLVNSDSNNNLLLKEFARNRIPIHNENAVLRLYETEKSSDLAKQIHDQFTIIKLLQNETSLGIKHILLKNLTDEETLEKYAISETDWGTKEIVFWRLGDSQFISDLIKVEKNEKYKEILKTRLDMLNSVEEGQWFAKLCDRQIEKFKLNSNNNSLNEEEVKIKDFLIYFYSSIYGGKLKLLRSIDNLDFSSRKFRRVIPSLIPYITIQETIKYAIDDRINETSSKLTLSKLKNDKVKFLSVAELAINIEGLKTIYFDNEFRKVLISLTDNSTYTYPKSDKYFRKVNIKKSAKPDVIVYPKINMIFNSDITKVKIDMNSGDQGETKFYIKDGEKWIPSNKDGAGEMWMY